MRRTLASTIRKPNEKYILAGMEINFSMPEYLTMEDQEVMDLEIDDDLTIKGCKDFT